MTYLSIGLVGHGAVALGHVAGLSVLPGVRTTAVLGRDAERTARFAGQIGADPFRDVESFAEEIDFAIIATPTRCHAEQSIALLELGVPVLVELPAAASSGELANVLAATASGTASIRATHTARFLAGSELVAEILGDGRLGSVLSVTIDRAVRRRDKAWADDPLLHHGQHAFDLLDMWFGAVVLDRASFAPDEKSIAVAGSVSDGVPFSLHVTHDAHQEFMRVSIEGSLGWLRTDGFGRATATVGLGGWVDRDPADAYLAAIAAQDAAVVGSMRGVARYPTIEAAARTTALVEMARGLARGT